MVGTTAGAGITGAGAGTAGAGIIGVGIIGAGEAATATLITVTDADTAAGPTTEVVVGSIIEIRMQLII